MKNINNEYEEYSKNFIKHFASKEGFAWFLIIIFAFSVGIDDSLSDVIRMVGFENNDNEYRSLLNFLRSATPEQLLAILKEWAEEMLSSAQISRTKDGGMILVSDATGVPREGNRIPNVSKLSSRSEDSSKPEYFKGINYEFIGVLVGEENQFVAPLKGWIASGNKTTNTWNTDGTTKPQEVLDEERYTLNASHTVQSVRAGYRIVTLKEGEKGNDVFDRGYIGITLFITWLEEMSGVKPGTYLRFIDHEYKCTDEELAPFVIEAEFEEKQSEDAQQPGKKMYTKPSQMQKRGIISRAEKLVERCGKTKTMMVTVINGMEKILDNLSFSSFLLLILY